MPLLLGGWYAGAQGPCRSYVLVEIYLLYSMPVKYLKDVMPRPGPTPAALTLVHDVVPGAHTLCIRLSPVGQLTMQSMHCDAEPIDYYVHLAYTAYMMHLLGSRPFLAGTIDEELGVFVDYR